MTETDTPRPAEVKRNPFGIERSAPPQLKQETSGNKVSRNPFGIEPTVSVENTDQQNEVGERVNAIRVRKEMLMKGEIPIDQMTDSEKAAHLLANLKK
jgi:hypothetical protein